MPTSEIKNYYVGPVIHIEKKQLRHIDIQKRINTCSNEKCCNYKKEVDGLPNFCTQCGHKIEYLKFDIKLEETFFMRHRDQNHKFIIVSNKNINGNNFYMDKDNQIFTSDNEIVFIPMPVIDNRVSWYHLERGIHRTIESGKFCVNSNCLRYNIYLNSTFKFCDDCGKRLTFKSETYNYGVLNAEKSTVVFETYSNSNFDNIRFISNPTFENLVKDYSESDEYRFYFDIFEDTYGKGSTSLKLAFIQYHDMQ